MYLEGIGMTSKRTRARLADRLRSQGIENEEIISLMQDLPRHLFVQEALAHRAYDDVSLPIGCGQTISQPYIVAKMTELLIAGRNYLPKVLEIGTGSGYQTAILANFCGKVYSTERIAQLQNEAKKVLKGIHIDNVSYFKADGSFGLEKYAPFDGIISTCAPETIPEPLLLQLSEDCGRLVIPVGKDSQILKLVERTGDNFRTTDIEPVIFVPLLKGII